MSRENEPRLAAPKVFYDLSRLRILEDPFYLADVLGWRLEPFHRKWARFCLDHPKHVLEAARGFGKSTVCTSLLAIWWIVRDPNVRILIVSATEDIASRILREIRGQLEQNRILRACFGEFVGTGQWTDKALAVAQRTAVHKEATVSAVGLDGPIIGGHWNHILIDDPVTDRTCRSNVTRDRAFQWLFTTLMPTLLPGGTVGIRCTRYHYNDLAGRIERDLALDARTGEAHLYRLEGRDEPLPAIPRDARWKVLQTPAIGADGSSLWESQFPLEDRDEPDGTIKEGLRTKQRERERSFSQQYQMVCPEEADVVEETEFKRSWFRSWAARPELSRLAVFQFVDPAFRSHADVLQRGKRERDPDYFAIGVVGFERATRRVFILDVLRDRLSPVERELRARQLADRWHPALIEVERTGLQIREAPEFYSSILRALAPHRARFGQPRKDKVARAQPFARAMDRGLVEWNPEVLEAYPCLVDEFARFPYDQHDDLVDAVSGAYLLGERPRRSIAGWTDRQRGIGPDPSAPGAVQRGTGPDPSARGHVPGPGYRW